ncbi:preprotein translocase subunit SecG [Acidocella sp.]|uniref:preprotein translocase subunit SecG n=1 Tax=Acidocella sp. TaxID=50710 RepID=UPI002602CDA3|nr:preprotein translocase subunit SecG [Acidocella sp.]
MIKVLLVLHVFVTIALIGVVLIQRSEGGGLGLGGGQGMGSFMTGRGTANLLTRATAILGTVFFINSLVLAMHFKGAASAQNAAILNGGATPAAPISAPAQPAGAPAAPSVPLPSSLPSTPADALPAPAAPSAPAAPAAPGSAP